MSSASGKDRLNRVAQFAGPKWKEFGDEDQVDEVLGPTAYPITFVTTRIGMQLLRSLLSQRYSRHMHRSDSCEPENIGHSETLRRPDRLMIAHIEQKCLERAARQRRVHPEPSAAAKTVGRRRRTFDRKNEVIADLVGSCFQQQIDHLLICCRPVQVDVFGATRAIGETHIKSEAALQQPLIWSHGDQPSQQPVKCDPLTLASDPGAIAAGTCLETVLQRPAERCRVGVPHECGLSRAPFTKLLTRPDRPAEAARSRRGVVSPRSIAWAMASSTCSGCTPASIASTIARSGLVTVTPATLRTSAPVGGRSTEWIRTPLRGRCPRFARGTDTCTASGITSARS